MTDRSLQQWLNEYGESHRNPTNILIHKVCVPAIFWSLLGMFYGIGHPISHGLGFVLILAGLVFYFRLGVYPFLGMAGAVVLCLLSFYWIDGYEVSLFLISLAVFVIAWIGQFIGHKIEGKKPSFIQDLQFLLIGPLWVVLYKRTQGSGASAS